MQLPLHIAMKLAPVLRSPRAEVGLAFRHLATGEAWVHNDRRFPAGDLIRLAIALGAYRAVHEGRAALHKRVSPRSMPAGPECRPTTIRELLRRTLQDRDFIAPRLLLEQIDARAINRSLAAWGLALTTVDGPPGEAILHVTTPAEMAILLGQVAGIGDLPAEARQEALTFLRLAEPHGALRKLSGGADPAHLAAEGDTFRHLVLISAGGGGYLLAILTEGKIGAPALAKIVATIDAHYGGVHESFGRVMATLETERSRVAPDSRTVVWDVRPVWQEGRLELIGRSSAPGWPAIVDLCRQASDAPLVDRVRRLGATPPWAIALAPVVHLRKEPTHASELASQLVMGALVEVLEAGEEWWHVRAPDGMVAWARSTNLQPATDRDAQRWRSRDQVLVTAPLVTAPRLTRGVVTLSAGTRLAFVGRRKDHLLGRTPGREEVLLPAAACRHECAEGVAEAPAAAAILRLAELFLGVPYLWGGTSGWGLDCSGFTQLVFRLAGLRIPRDSDQQRQTAQAHGPIPLVKDLAPGDLVFFDGHVGIYLGGGDFIHASAPAGCVTVNALIPGVQHYASGLARRFLGGGRLLGG